MNTLASLAERILPRRSLRPLRRIFHSSLRGVRSIVFYGRQYYCPLCRRGLRRFRPGGSVLPQLSHHKLIGIGFREHRECPICFATDKERHQFLCLTEHLTVLSRERIKLLHVAPEPNPRRHLESSPRIDYLCGDLSSKRVDVQLDIHCLPFADERFDAILCSHVLEHVHDDRKAMAELHRILKPGGWAILQAPVSLSLEETLEDPEAQSDREREAVFGQSDHVRLYGRDYVTRLQAEGFDVELYNYASVNGPKAGARRGLLVNEDIYVCWKRETAS